MCNGGNAMATTPRTKYIVDSRGRRTGVVISIKDFEAMVREIQDLRDAQFVDEAEASSEEFIELSDLKRDLSSNAR